MPDKPELKELRINGIANPRCKCTPEQICRLCESKTLRCGPKFKEPWNEAVKIDKGEKP